MPPSSDPRDSPRGALSQHEVDPDPIRQFVLWFAEAERAGIPQPEAMALATSTAEGRPSSRMVLLKGVDEGGFVFYTNYDSRKGRDLEAHPPVSLLFPWHDLQRQVRVEGTASRVSEEESQAYFASRPRASQLGAWASPQSQEVSSRA